MMIEVSPEVRDRLMRLATYLDTLPKDYKEFHMGQFFNHKVNDFGHELERKYALENGGVGACGTNACAVGHGPSAGILVPEDLIAKPVGCDWWEVDWYQYARMFTDDQKVLYTWLFSGWWTRYDNHHYGAAARIKYVLMGLEIPNLDPFGIFYDGDYVAEAEAAKAIVALYVPYRKHKCVGLSPMIKGK